MKDNHGWKRALALATAGLVIGVGVPAVLANVVGQVEASAAASAPAKADKRPKPTVTSSPTTTTSSPSPTASPTVTDSPSPSPTASGTVEPVCSTGGGVSFEGQTYCPGFIVGVTSDAYGVGTRVVLQSVAGVDGTLVTIGGGPSCQPDPSGEPVACGDMIPGMNVDFAGLASIPAYGDVIDLYGITGTEGTLSPAGFAVIGSCDPYWGEC
jgi:hypothetical protein